MEWITKCVRDSVRCPLWETLRCFNHCEGPAFCMHAKPIQSCPTLFDPIDCRPPGSSVYGDSPGKNSGVGCHALLQGIFPTQASNPTSFTSPALAGGFLAQPGLMPPQCCSLPDIPVPRDPGRKLEGGG